MCMYLYVYIFLAMLWQGSGRSVCWQNSCNHLCLDDAAFLLHLRVWQLETTTNTFVFEHGRTNCLFSNISLVKFVRTCFEGHLLLASGNFCYLLN